MNKCVFYASSLSALSLSAVAATDDRPNVLLILCDDMGYSDITCYGGEIHTPNLDQLAEEGIRFTQFYNAARSCPTRASLMTGLYPHEAGIGAMTGSGRYMKGTPYMGYLNPNTTVTIAEVMRSAGYATGMAGKWHAGTEEVAWPSNRGFDDFYGTHNWIDSYLRVLKTCDIYENDQVAIGEVPKDLILKTPEGKDWYTTDVFTDKSIEFIKKYSEEDKPFFLYTAYNSPHWPLEAHDEIIKKHVGKYKEGWTKLIEVKTKRMKKMGILTDDCEIGWQDMVDWDSLSDDDKENLDFRRAIYAAQVEIMDDNIGRLVATLKETGEYENTIIMFLSDNGCSAEPETEKFGYSWEENRKSNYAEWKRNSARAGASQGLMWAIASNAPFRKYKKFIHEGGISTPLIVSYPAMVAKGRASELVHTPGFLPDIMATCVEAARTKYPLTYEGNVITPTQGRSLIPALRGEKLEEHKAIYWEHENHAGVRMGDWKLVTEDIRGEVKWELYNIPADRTEMNDLASVHPDKVNEMKKLWRQWAVERGVLPKLRKVRK